MEEKNSIYCTNCGMRNEEGDLFCGNCGTRLEIPIEAPAFTPAAAASQSNAAMQEVPAPAASQSSAAMSEVSAPVATGSEKGSGYATASLVLGIAAVACWFFGYGALISVICGFFGTAMAGRAKNEGNESGIRTAGYVLSLIGIIGGIIVLIICIVLLGSVYSMFSSF